MYTCRVARNLQADVFFRWPNIHRRILWNHCKLRQWGSHGNHTRPNRIDRLSSGEWGELVSQENHASALAPRWSSSTSAQICWRFSSSQSSIRIVLSPKNIHFLRLEFSSSRNFYKLTLGEWRENQILIFRPIPSIYSIQIAPFWWSQCFFIGILYAC